jgi:hypothetical protein
MHIINNKVLKIISIFFYFILERYYFFKFEVFKPNIFFLCEHKLHINSHIKKIKISFNVLIINFNISK